MENTVSPINAVHLAKADSPVKSMNETHFWLTCKKTSVLYRHYTLEKKKSDVGRRILEGSAAT